MSRLESTLLDDGKNMLVLTDLRGAVLVGDKETLERCLTTVVDEARPGMILEKSIT
jgi:hypothetical protein